MSEATRQLVDSEVRRIIDECYDTALALLNENRSRLEALATTLLERETLDEADAYDAAGFPASPAAHAIGGSGTERM
jgi:cell division protease FtsH